MRLLNNARFLYYSIGTAAALRYLYALCVGIVLGYVGKMLELIS
mgnify:CR=1 FL=1